MEGRLEVGGTEGGEDREVVLGGEWLVVGAGERGGGVNGVEGTGGKG